VTKKRFLPVALVVPAIILAVALLAGTGGAASKVTFRAGLVSDVGRFNDKGFNQNQLTGLKLAKTKLGVQIRAIESHSANDYIPNLASLARLHYDAVVAAGFLLANAEATVAKKFPNTQFAITDYPVEAAPFSDKKGKLLVKNITGITFKSEQQSYLVGCLSALMAKKGGGNTISATGGVKIPPVDSLSPATRPVPRSASRARRSSWGTRRTSSPRTSARRWRRTRSRPARRSSSRSQVPVASARWRRPRRPASGVTASMSTSRTSARTF